MLCIVGLCCMRIKVMRPAVLTGSLGLYFWLVCAHARNLQERDQVGGGVPAVLATAKKVCLPQFAAVCLRQTHARASQGGRKAEGGHRLGGGPLVGVIRRR